MNPFRAFLVSFAATSFFLFGGHVALADLVMPPPDVRIGPIDIPTP